ncbi:MAG: hypothetical protein AAGU23_02210, partial [Bacillota bacterium]
GVTNKTLPAKKWNEYPVIRAITGAENSNPQQITDFYERLDEMEKKYKGSGAKNPPKELSDMRKTSKTLTELHGLERKIMNDNTMDPKTKRNKLDLLQEKEYQAVKRVIK